MKVHQTAIPAVFLLTLAFIAAACSSRPYMRLHYQLPAQSSALQSKHLSVTVKGDGVNRLLLSPKAKKSLTDFNDTFTLVVQRQNGTGDLAGIYRPASLLAEIFTRRLLQLGVTVSSSEADNVPELKITLQQFKLDLVDVKWVVDITYRAQLLSSGRVLAERVISGQARRLKILGKNDAEKVIDELLTDMVNRLDIIQLFQQAGL